MKNNCANKNSNKIIILLQSIVIVIFYPLTLFAQQNDFHISYLGQISSTESNKNTDSYLGFISDILFGKAEIGLQRPVGLLTYNNNLWVADPGQNTIIYFDKTQKLFYIPDCENINLISPAGICKSGKNILFSDSGSNTLFVFNTEENRIMPFQTEYNFSQPTGIACNSVTGDFWISETGVHQLVLMSSSGIVKKIIGRRGSAEGQFNFPGFIWIDRDGVAYVVDALNFRVQIFDADGNFVSMFGEAGDASGYLARPKGIATDSYGNIYVVDALFNTVQIFDRVGNYLYNFGKKGSGEEEFMLPMGIFIDASDQIYVADSYNQRVQIFKISRESAFENSDKN